MVLAQTIASENEDFSKFARGLAPEVHYRLEKARQRIIKNGYALKLYYVTTGKCSSGLIKEADQTVRGADCDAVFEIFDGRRILPLLDYYLRDVAPPVSSLDLEMEGGSGIEIKGIFHRYDKTTDIESWIFSMNSHGVADMFRRAGNRLFALNIRGYLGTNKEINKGMEYTLDHEPEYFWYYNNGLTVVCDHAEKISSHGKDILRVTNPQVINGQQTTRTLAKVATNSSRASVTVRVIRIPHESTNDSNHFDTLVPRIVKATNWQNAIAPSDLIANDRRQIEIHRQLRKLGYWYVRKRQTKSEARREAGAQHYWMLNKIELAQAVAGCDLDPAIVRGGKENLFEERLYGTVFPTSDPYYYLCRYWLMGTVAYAARGYPERAYAKWVVLNFMWSRIGPLVRSRSRSEHFQSEWEQNGKGLDHLWRMNTAVYSAALQFYRLKRGKGAKAADVSTFFKRKNLHRAFEKFWHSPGNNHRAKFQKAFKKFEILLSRDFD